MTLQVVASLLAACQAALCATRHRFGGFISKAEPWGAVVCIYTLNFQGLGFMEGVMLETGQCDCPVCPAMESDKLETYLDATLSQPNPKYLHKTPRSEQTVVL